MKKKKNVPHYRLLFEVEKIGHWSVYICHGRNGSWLSFVGNTPVL